MSYCRLSECDAYAYDSVEGGVRFYVADGRRDLDRLCRTYNEAYQYMKTLRDQYELDVPDHAIEALKADAIEEAVRICGPNIAVSELEAENNKLREELEAAKHDLQVFSANLARLGAENAKLRELVRVFYHCTTSGECDECSINGGGPVHLMPDTICDTIHDRMRELGVDA